MAAYTFRNIRYTKHGIRAMLIPSGQTSKTLRTVSNYSLKRSKVRLQSTQQILQRQRTHTDSRRNLSLGSRIRKALLASIIRFILIIRGIGDFVIVATLVSLSPLSGKERKKLQKVLRQDGIIKNTSKQGI